MIVSDKMPIAPMSRPDLRQCIVGRRNSILLFDKWDLSNPTLCETKTGTPPIVDEAKYSCGVGPILCRQLKRPTKLGMGPALKLPERSQACLALDFVNGLLWRPTFCIAEGQGIYSWSCPVEMLKSK